MQMTEAPGEPNAHTCLELIEEPSHHIWTRWQLHPTTGCKHQLRVHMAALRMPILGDRIYPTLQPSLEGCVPDYREPLRLLAKALSFRCPVTGVDRQFESRFSLAV